ncbi:PilZ domain-containing protein [Pseudahrensia aquimaris]|uniref:PilZ domain-containing protein n=1 Tax=Pseudahrensia aquimaris TaxID=744461 RepID=A0ABW3FDU9_9HYPH
MTEETAKMPSDEELTPGERERRQRVLKKGVVSYNDGAISSEVMVRDFSSQGVKIKMTNDVPIPDHFTLDIPMDGIRIECEVRWRERDTLGVRFISKPTIRSEPHRAQLKATGIPQTLRRRPT